MTSTIAPSSSRQNRKSFGRSRLRKGFTLFEVMAATFLGSLLVAGATTTMTILVKSSVGMGYYSEMNGETRRALETFSSDVRMAVSVSNSQSSVLSFESYQSDGSTQTITYNYNADAGTLTRTAGGSTTTLLDDLEDFSFSYFTYLDSSFETTELPANVKEVQIRALMQKRVITASKTNEVISARYMMRNKSVGS